MNLHNIPTPRRAPVVALLLITVLLASLVASCSPIVEEQMRPWEATRIAKLAAGAPDATTPEPAVPVTIVSGAQPTPEPTAEAEATSEAGATPETEATVEPDATAAAREESAPTATIGVEVLRVREAPSTNADVIGVVYADQIYPVIGRSSDGLWMQLGEIPGIEGETGWVISELALVIGDFSTIPVVQVPDEPAVAPSRNTEEGTGNTPNLPTPTPQPTEESAEPTEAIVQPEPIVTLDITPRAPASGATPIGETTDGGTDGSDGTDGTDSADAPPATPEPATEPATETPAQEPTEEPAAEAPAAPVVSNGGGAPLPAGVESPPAGFALVVTDGIRLRVRDLPSTDSLIVGYAYPGETFRVLQQSDDGAWTQINGSPQAKENASGGWVATEFLYIGR